MAVHMLCSGVMSVRVDQSHDAASTLVAPAVYLKTPHTNTHSFKGKHFFQSVPLRAHSRTPRKIRRGKRQNIVATRRQWGLGDSGCVSNTTTAPHDPAGPDSSFHAPLSNAEGGQFLSNGRFSRARCDDLIRLDVIVTSKTG